MEDIKQKRRDSIPGYLYPLDGLRAISVILIYIFHSWQQSWIFFSIPMSQGKNLINLVFLQQSGFIAIDAFFVLSGFCLFYPIARAMFGESEDIKWKEFYIKRAKKILPSYYLMLILLIIFPALSYGTNPQNVVSHVLTHMAFVHNFSDKTIGSTISTAWTMSMEVQFYIIFPLIAKMFRKKPVLTFLAILVFSQCFRLYVIANFEMTTLTQSNTLLYLDIFAWGMLGAYFVVYARNKLKNIDKLKVLMTIIAFLSIVIVCQFAKWMLKANMPNVDSSAYFRMLYRDILAGAFAIFLFTSCYSCRFWERGIWGNKFMVFCSTISYNFYLWHQNIHILLKRLNIPYTTVQPPTSDRVAMDGFVFLSFTLSLIISVCVTYLIEIPISKFKIKNYKNIKNRIVFKQNSFNYKNARL